MSWMSTLIETYDNLQKSEKKDLIPIAHSTQNAHIEVTLNLNSEYVSARLISKDNAKTLIPVTESSASRSSGITPHPLSDKLQYIAGDFTEYASKNGEKHFKAYIEQLERWSKSNFSNIKINIILEYLKKENLISDLLESKILSLDEKNKLNKKFDDNDIKIAVGNQEDSLIRFRVITNDGSEDATWQDEKLIESYIGFYLSIKQKEEKGFCYIAGENRATTTNHPSKIRNTGDMSKLISSNDTQNFTYLGRFKEAKEAVEIGFEASQKAHNALKWVISNQGVSIDKKTFVLWGTNQEKSPSIIKDTYDIAFDFLPTDKQILTEDPTNMGIAREFNKAIKGYKAEIKPNTSLALLGLESVTTGRMSMIFYREYNGEEGHELIDNIKKWHDTVSWKHGYKFVNRKRIVFLGAPSIKDIALFTYGTEQNSKVNGDEKIIANAMERLLPCITDGKKIPRDIPLRLIKKATYPQNYQEPYNWYKLLTISCAIYSKYLYDYKKEEYNMEVKETSNLAYNCGRMLAIADAIENWALREVDEGGAIRTTNAMRYFTRFSVSPCTTWGIINDKLNPYKQRLGAKGGKLYKLLGEISSLIDPEDFKNASNLDGCMILGFDTQRQALFNNENKTEK